MSVDIPTVTNTNNTTNNYYYNNTDDRNAPDNVSAGPIENLPAGTTEQDVANAISNSFALAVINDIENRLEADQDMDPAMKQFLLGQLEIAKNEHLIDVDPAVQTKTDAVYGEHSAAMAQSFMDRLMEQFKETASEERSKEARKVDSDEGGSEEAGGAGNWLIKLAKALAEVQSMWLDKLMDSYQKMQDHTVAEGSESDDDTKKAADAEHQKAFIAAQAEVTAYARLFGMASEVTSNVIKSIGDGLTSVARKQ